MDDSDSDSSKNDVPIYEDENENQSDEDEDLAKQDTEWDVAQVKRLAKPTLSSPDVVQRLQNLDKQAEEVVKKIERTVAKKTQEWETEQMQYESVIREKLSTSLQTLTRALNHFKGHLSNSGLYHDAMNAVEKSYRLVQDILREFQAKHDTVPEKVASAVKEMKASVGELETNRPVMEKVLPTLVTRAKEFARRVVVKPIRKFFGYTVSPPKTEEDLHNTAEQQWELTKFRMNGFRAAFVSFHDAFLVHMQSVFLRDKQNAQWKLETQLSDESQPEQQRLGRNAATIKKLLVQDRLLQGQMEQTRVNLTLQEPSLQDVARRAYASSVLTLFRKHEMKAVDRTGEIPNDCAQGAATTLKPYQTLIADVMDPKASVVPVGIVVGYGTGSGKSAIGIECCKRYVLAPSSAAAARPPILILVPNDNLVANWRSEFQRWCPEADGWTLAPVPKWNKKSSTFGFVLGKKGLGEGASRLIVLHTMTLALPETLPDAWSPTSVVLPLVPDDKTLRVYTSAEWSAQDLADVQSRARRLETEILKKANIALPDGGLVIVDEGHNLVDPSEIANSQTSITVLAWANAIRASDIRVKKEIMTATFFDPDKLTLSFKLLNSVKPQSEKRRMFEGFWRPLLTIDDSKAETKRLKVAYAKATHAENQHVRLIMKEDSFRVNLVDDYGGLLYYLTLENDPRVFPQYATDRNRVFVWNGRGLEQLKDNQAACKLPVCEIPDKWKEQLVYVPMSKKQDSEMRKAMKADLEKHKKNDVSQIDFGAPKAISKSGMLETWGTRFYTEKEKGSKGSKGTMSNPKMDVVVYLLAAPEYASDKFFVFSAAMDNHFLKQVKPFFRGAGYEVWDLQDLNKRVKSGVALSTLVDDVYHHLEAKRRVLLLPTPIGKVNEMKDPGLTRRFLIALFNHEQNIQGKYFKMLLGDRKSKEGLSLMYTRHAIMLDEPANQTLMVQSRARITRYCSMSKLGPKAWTNMRLWQLVSIPASKSNQGQANWTNEEYQLQKRLQRGNEATLENWLQEIAADCHLFYRYNLVSMCYGAVTGSTGVEADRVCGSTQRGVQVSIGGRLFLRLSRDGQLERMHVSNNDQANQLWSEQCGHRTPSTTLVPANVRDAIWLAISTNDNGNAKENETANDKSPLMMMLASLQTLATPERQDIIHWNRLWNRMSAAEHRFARAFLAARVPEQRSDLHQFARDLGTFLDFARQRQRIADDIVQLSS